MVIKYKPKFERELKAVFDFIAKDSLNSAREFRNELIAKIERVSQMPLIAANLLILTTRAYEI